MRFPSVSRVFERAMLTIVLFAAARAGGAATITVTGTGDTIAVDGVVTLREAITSINNGANLNADVVAVGAYGTSDTINFNISGTGVHTITPASNLPTIMKAVLINGYSQSGASANTAAFPGALNSVLLIELNNSTNTFEVDAGPTTIKGLVFNRGSDEILINADNVTIQGNFIGTDPTGLIAKPNIVGGFGVRTNGARNNAVIGGPNPADRNLISGDLQGGIIGSGAGGTGTLIQGNYIGPDKTGAASIANGIGLNNIHDTIVLNNLISGNPGAASHASRHSAAPPPPTSLSGAT